MFSICFERVLSIHRWECLWNTHCLLSISMDLDPSLIDVQVTAGLDWATTTDLLQKEIVHNQKWSLGVYIPLSFVAYHFLFASNTKTKLQFPNQYQEVSEARRLIKSFRLKLILYQVNCGACYLACLVLEHSSGIVFCN